MADDDELVVSISGPAFAMLLYENTRIHDQIGFLLGETLVYESTKVTDSDKDVQQRKLHINIKSVVSYPLGEPFFNGIGQVKEDLVKSLLGNRYKNIVGWYHYREEFRLAVSFRDSHIHNGLTALVSKTNPLIGTDKFMLCLLSSSINETGGTHKFKHLLLHRKNRGFKPLPLRIKNLGADVTTSDGSDYKPAPTYRSSDTDTFDIVYDHVKSSLEKTSGVESVTLIEKAAEHLLDKLTPEISRTDKEVSELEERVALLRNEIFQAQFESFKESFNSLEQQMEKMEVDPKPYVKLSPNSSSPEIFNSPKSPMPSTSAASGQSPSNVQHDGSGDQSSQEKVSSDQELKKSSSTPLSPSGGGSRLGESAKLPEESTSPISNTIERNKGPKTRQKTDQFIQSTATRSSKSQHRGLCTSPTNDPNS